MRAMLYVIVAVGSVLMAALLVATLIALTRPSDSPDLERLVGRDWWPRFERQFAEYVERLREGRA
jgi:hypothetical protein